MVFADWTFSKDVLTSGYASLDLVIKYAGNSSCKLHVGKSGPEQNVYFTHNTFSQAQAQIIFWFYSTSISSAHTPYMHHASYGYVPISYLYRTVSTWEKFKVSFWYDITTNTKWGGLEKYIGSTWVKQGDNLNFGSDSPALGTIRLRARLIGTINDSFDCWFDEIDVYS